MFELKPIPENEKIEFKEEFVKRYSKLTDWEEFRKYSLSFLRKSIRVNTLKISSTELLKRLEKNWYFEKIPWCKEGYWIEHKKGRLDVGNTREHALGYYYIQEAASMIPPEVLEPKPGDIVMDMCASPGSKASQTAQKMENKGLLVANDITGERLAALGINLQRMGVSNCIVTQVPGEKITGLKFDKILLDAPCSGTGTIRKSIKTIKMWNPQMIKHIAGIQRKLLMNAITLVKPGGTLVYSTCSLEPEENEAVIDYALSKGGIKLEEVELQIKKAKPVMEFEGKVYDKELKNCLRIWPQDNDTEGFFVAKIRKE